MLRKLFLYYLRREGILSEGKKIEVKTGTKKSLNSKSLDIIPSDDTNMTQIVSDTHCIAKMDFKTILNSEANL